MVDAIDGEVQIARQAAFARAVALHAGDFQQFLEEMVAQSLQARALLRKLRRCNGSSLAKADDARRILRACPQAALLLAATGALRPIQERFK